MHKTIAIPILLLSLLAASCAPQPQAKTTLVVFAAGSLIVPFGALEKAFEASHPEIDVQIEYHGSIQVIRHATELHEAIDIIATADHALIPALMYTSQIPDTSQPYASWYIRFASNRLALAYTDRSARNGDINAENWYEIIADPAVRLGIADPRFDAAGYRALMALKLAEQVYNQPLLFSDILRGQFAYSFTTRIDNGVAVIRVPEIVQTTPDAHILIRGASIQLLALLQSGDLDYAFEYESVIRQHGLNMVTLPASLNLGENEYAEAYRQVQVTLDFQRFASVAPQFTGEVIGYGVTIPNNAPHPAEAETFIAFLLSAEGRAIMEANYHPMLTPAQADQYADVPAALAPLCSP